MIKLHPFQMDSVQAVEAMWRRHRRVLLVIPTGGGKTICATETIKRRLISVPQARVCFMAHRAELISQSAGKLRETGLIPGIIKAGYEPDPLNRLQVASVQTFRSRMLDAPPPLDLIVFDEVHRREYEAIYNLYPNTQFLGLTATPERLGGKTLHGEYDAMHVGITYSAAIHEKYIVPCKAYAPPSSADIDHIRLNSFGDFAEDAAGEEMGKITGDIITHWRKYANDMPTIMFACSIAHGESIARKLSLDGITNALLTGKDSEDNRTAVIASHKAGHVRIIINVGLFTEGLDLPWARCVVMARPTMSLALYLQMAGRGCRSMADKDNYVLLDHAGNISRHGLPDTDRTWSLEPNKRRKAGTGSAPVKFCGQCFAAMAPSVAECPECGNKLETHAKLPEYVEGSLVEVSREVEPPPPGAVPWEKQRRRYFYEFRFIKISPYALIRKVNQAMSRHRSITWNGQRMALPISSVIGGPTYGANPQQTGSHDPH